MPSLSSLAYSMSKLIPHSRTRQAHSQGRAYRAPIVKADFHSPQPRVTLRDGTIGTGVCLGCYDSPCMVVSDPPVRRESPLATFPGTQSTNLCPTDAIRWAPGQHTVEISRKDCIGCGLCAARCPYGAITLDAGGTAIVQADDQDEICVVAKTDVSVHPNAERLGMLGRTSPRLDGLTGIIAALPHSEAAAFVRNVLATCGVRTSMRRVGDQNVRMDGVFEMSSGDIGPLEVELGTDALESLRRLLEDIAVLHRRYGITLSDVKPLNLILDLPSTRSEYYQLVTDIEKVTGVRCHTVTLGVLISLMWQFETISDLGDGLFFVEWGQYDLWGAMRRRWPKLAQLQMRTGAYSPRR